MPHMKLESDEKGDYGEDRARKFLRSLFYEQGKPSRDRGTDILCSGPRWIPFWMPTPVIRFQVKNAESYIRSGIPFSPTSLDQLLQRIERDPVIVLYYNEPEAGYDIPDCFLVLHRWILSNKDKVLDCLAASRELHIPHADFEHLRPRTATLKEALTYEFKRATDDRGHPLASRHDQLPEYAYIRRFQKVVRIWDISLLPSPEMMRLFGVAHPSQLRERLSQATESDSVMRAILRASGRTHKHPLSRIPPTALETAQSQYYQALLKHSTGETFHLPQRFTVSESAAGRAMAAKYPNLISRGAGAPRVAPAFSLGGSQCDSGRWDTLSLRRKGCRESCDSGASASRARNPPHANL